MRGPYQNFILTKIQCVGRPYKTASLIYRPTYYYTCMEKKKTNETKMSNW